MICLHAAECPVSARSVIEPPKLYGSFQKLTNYKQGRLRSGCGHPGFSVERLLCVESGLSNSARPKGVGTNDETLFFDSHHVSF